MALASSGVISIGGTTATRSINLELSRSATATSSLGEADLRTLAGVSSGAISMSNFYGKSAGFTFTAGLSMFFQSWSTPYGGGSTYTSSVYGYDKASQDGYFQDFFQVGGWSSWDLANDNGFGALSPNTFTDGGGTTRTIVQLAESTGANTADYLILALSGTSVPNSNTTFTSITIGTTTLTRASASYAASYNGGTYWSWSDPNLLTSTGSKTFAINI